MKAVRAFATGCAVFLAACNGTGGPPIFAAPQQDVARQVDGQLFYSIEGPNLGNKDSHGRLVSASLGVSAFPAPAAHVPIELLDASGGPLQDVNGNPARIRTGPNGEFSIRVNFGQRPATQIVVRTDAQLDFGFGTKVRVLPFEGAAAPYSYQSPPLGNPDDLTMRILAVVPENRSPGAWNICAVLFDGFLTAKSGITDPNMPDLDVIYSTANGEVSSFVGTPLKGKMIVAGGVPSDPTANTDAWDDPVVMRLMGEYLLHFYFLETAPPSAVPTDDLMVPTLAWREGFLDFWACMGRGSTIFWDTEGQRADGRVTRFFNIESFFDESLKTSEPIPNDPNVYQPPGAVGIGSRFTVAEVLWDLHDKGTEAGDTIEFPFALSVRLMRQPAAGQAYPYLVTLLDAIVNDNALPAILIRNLMAPPAEDQGVPYPANEMNGSLWPPAFRDGIGDTTLFPPYDDTLSGQVDTTGAGADLEAGLNSQRYFRIKIAADSNVRITLATTGALEVDFMDLLNNVIATDSSVLALPGVKAAGYIIRVRATQLGRVDPFDIRVQLTP